MFEVLSNSVMPVFAMAALGMLATRMRWFSVPEADALSRFVYYVPMPVLLFRLLATSDLSHLDYPLLASYLGLEVVLYAAVTAVFFHVFGKSFRESLLLGLASAFANHLLYLLPMAIFRFGETIAAEMVTFVIVDVLVIYSATLVLLDATSAGGKAPLAVAGRLVRNPQIIAIVLGLAANIVALPLDNGLGVFAKFAGDAASPASLFALGVILASQSGKSDWRVVSLVSVVKLVLFPLVMAGVLLGPLGLPFERSNLAILVATAPSAVASFVLAVRYGVPARDLSFAVLITTLLSIFSISVVLQFM